MSHYAAGEKINKKFDILKFARMISVNSDVNVIVIKDEENLKNFFKEFNEKRDYYWYGGRVNITLDEKFKTIFMNFKKSELIKKFGKNIFFQEDLSKYSWFNLGGPANILFKPESIEQLKNFLNYINNSLEITCLGAGSNTLIRDGGFNGVVIKLSPKFSYIKQIEKNILEVGAATLDKNLSRYAAENSIVNFEFLSCIPGSVGGTIKMNSGCYGNEISDILISVQAIDLKGNLIEMKRDKIKFIYRGNNLPDDLIFLSARFHAKNGDGNLINEKIKKYSKEKKDSQPSQIKTCGSTFKNTKIKSMGIDKILIATFYHSVKLKYLKNIVTFC